MDINEMNIWHIQSIAIDEWVQIGATPLKIWI